MSADVADHLPNIIDDQREVTVDVPAITRADRDIIDDVPIRNDDAQQRTGEPSGYSGNAGAATRELAEKPIRRKAPGRHRSEPRLMYGRV